MAKVMHVFNVTALNSSKFRVETWQYYFNIPPQSENDLKNSLTIYSPVLSLEDEVEDTLFIKIVCDIEGLENSTTYGMCVFFALTCIH